MADTYTTLVSRLLFPLHERLKRHRTVAVRRRLEASQWWPRERLEAYRLARLKALLTRAGREVPYYRQLFTQLGFRPEAVSSLAEITRLPLLDKPKIRAHTQSLRAGDARGLAQFNTGGSSGEPLIFYIGRERVVHDVAAKWRATRWWGVDIGDRELVVWGSPIELGAQDRVRQWRDRLLRTRLLPAFAMSEAKLDLFVAQIRAFRPTMLFGYPSALSHIARHAQARGVRLDDLGAKVAFVTSEQLYPDQREAISTTFGCRVANGYGGRDAGFIAHECPQGGLHLTAEDMLVETVDGAGRPVVPGQAGEVVVTHFATGDFPFIRYRTGDVAVLDDTTCACGRSLPLIREVQGRTTDFLVAQDSTVMHGLALIYVLRELPGVRSFKIVQESLGLTRIQVVPEAATGDAFLDDALRARIVQGVRARLGQGVEVAVEAVTDIPPERSGKFRYVLSRVAPGAAPPAGRTTEPAEGIPAAEVESR